MGKTSSIVRSPVAAERYCSTATTMRTREKTMDGNMDLWMEDHINGGYGHILDRLDAEAKRDVVRQEQFQLGPPSDWDDLDEATTNGSSIEIEIIEE